MLWIPCMAYKIIMFFQGLNMPAIKGGIRLANEIERIISRAEKTAEFYEKKGNKFWAKAKKEGIGSYYKIARDCYERAKECRKAIQKFKGY